MPIFFICLLSLQSVQFTIQPFFLQSQAVSKLVKKWTRAINLKGNYGAHTLRKTWGYIQRTMHGVGFEIICERYNHSSPAITMRYLGIQNRDLTYELHNSISIIRNC